MKTRSVLRSLNPYYIALGALTAFSVLTLFQVAFAAEMTKCYGQYGQEIACPVVNKSVSVEKKVKLVGDDVWTESVNAKSGSRVEFQITVKNTGEGKLAQLRVIDVLPTQVSISEGEIDFIIDQLEVGAQVTRVIHGVVNDKDITDGQTKCVVNVVNVVYQGNQESSDTASVCVQRHSQVLAELPQTALSQNQVVGLAIILMLLGLIFYNVSLMIDRPKK